MDIRSYLLEKDFKIIMNNNQVDIMNYHLIETVSSDKIVLKYENGFIEINGENLVIKKMLNDEILIIGKIKKIDLR